MDIHPHGFEAPVVRHDVGTYLPEALGVQGRVPTRGELNDMPFSGASRPVRGRWHLMLSEPLLRETGAHIGSVVSISLRLEAPDTVEVPVALRNAPHSNPATAVLWAAPRPGQRRGLDHRVAPAKQPATVARRVAEPTHLLIHRGPFGPPPRLTRTTETPTP